MTSQAVFVPVSLLALWTGGVVLVLGLRRVRAARQGLTTPESFRLGEAPNLPDSVVLANRNLMNLLEMPLLFYVVCLSAFVTGHATGGFIRLAWIYVVLRAIHSVIHLTNNRVMLRLLAFAASNVVLVSLWAGFLRRLL